MPARHTRSLLIVSLLAMPGALLFGQTDDDNLTEIKEVELEQVRQQISNLKKSMDRRAAERDEVTTELQAAEGEISEIRQNLRDLERQRQFTLGRKNKLQEQLADEQQRLERESGLLAAQVKAAYTSGSEDRIKLLLNQADPAALGRQLVYYRYLSEMRGANIDAVNAIIAELSELHDKVAAEDAGLERLAKRRYAELTALNSAQEQRKALLASLKSKIAQEGSEIERLAQQERDLARLIAELTSILSDYPISSEQPFSDLKGKLTWPIAGRLLHDYGQPRAGGVKWNGVVLAAPRGREVRAIYHGRVVFADWLTGLGLLVIVDHGEGFMTLYGYNETTLKTTGDWVAPGDVIATVGDSGGRQQSGLYFEIRQDTRPMNPRMWVSRQPKTGE
ncbi:MAG: peptidoglycan DD-metalloendopeptidase family protein [Gammaproteobacteria bacterium]|nr:peptidoglycan DD-metalloendopeptidase family protein [Gammaproteobacteria bacterium]